jgi:hypothetical protein
MPYTPPSHTPVISRSHSYSHGLTSPLGRLELPRSTSYLSRHRRTPSLTKVTSFAPSLTIPESKSLAVQPVETTDDNSSNRKAVVVNGSLHQSPSPMNDSAIPSGAVISPPDSSQNSSDDESNMRKRRGRQLENLAELQAAIRIIEQRRESSPDRAKKEVEKAQAAFDFALPGLRSAMKIPNSDAGSTPPLSTTARKISHSRSSTESAIIMETTSPNSAEDSEEDENSLHVKPPLIRKKSGELVKPALRPAFGGRRRPSSMPGTPTYSKAVHFDSHLEHVRHFLQVDRPLAVSAGSSPVETYDSEGEFPFSDENARTRRPPFEWEIALSNFPRDSFERKQLPVKVERVFLSSDNKNLVGNAVVANLAFQKLVVVRFTLDYWKTTSEVVAEFNNDVRRKQLADGFDRFSFNIKLADQVNLENKTLFFCVRYNVNGQEFWDNNDSINFQVDFKKKALPQKGKHGVSSAGTRPAHSLPRSRPSPPVTTGRPQSMPASFDDFADGFDTKYDFSTFRQPAKKIIGVSPSSTIRLKSKAPTDVSSAKSNPANQPFANRYDFGASLTAAINAANTVLGDRSGLKSDWKPEPKYFAHSIANSSTSSSNATATAQTSESSTGSSSVSASTAKLEGGSSPRPPNLASEIPPLQSSSYHELLDKYCFVRSRHPPDA